MVLEDVRLSRYSDYFKTRNPESTALMTNLAEEDILAAKLVGLIHVQDESIVKFPVYPTQDISKAVEVFGGWCAFHSISLKYFVAMSAPSPLGALGASSQPLRAQTRNWSTTA